VKPLLKVQVVFDGTRTRRPSLEGNNTLDLLKPLTEKFGNRVTISLFSLPAPSTTRLPSPADEVLGVFHCKVFAIDDEVLISGGNLSTEYFVDRQDRYVHFSNADTLADFYHEFINRLSGCGEIISGQVKQRTIHDVSEMIKPSQPCQVSSEIDQNGNHHQNSFKTHQIKNESVDDGVDTWVYPTMQCAPLCVFQDEEVIKVVLKSASHSKHSNPPSSFFSMNLATPYLNPPSWLVDVLANNSIPLQVMTAHPSSHGFKSARGVMSVIPLCYQYILNKHIFPSFLSARKERNKNLKKEKDVLSMKQETQTQETQTDHLKFNLLSYERPYWTFHAKGLWITEHGSSFLSPESNNLSEKNEYFSARRDQLIKSQHQVESHGKLREKKKMEKEEDVASVSSSMVTIVGSSNYGRRSFNLDLEVQVAILTESQTLISELQNEWEVLEQYSTTPPYIPPTLNFDFLTTLRVALVSKIMGRFL